MPLTDQRGLPLGYTIVPDNEMEYEPLADRLTGTSSRVVIATNASGAATTPADHRPRQHSAHTRPHPHRCQRAARAPSRLHPTRHRSVFATPENRSDSNTISPARPRLALRIARQVLASHSESCSTPSTAAPHAPLAAYDGR